MLPESKEPQRCDRCRGCGRIADSEDGEPWSMWESLPPGSDAAVKLGIVKPIACPQCKGTGTLPAADPQPTEETKCPICKSEIRDEFDFDYRDSGKPVRWRRFACDSRMTIDDGERIFVRGKECVAPRPAAAAADVEKFPTLEEAVLSCIESWRLSQIREGSPVTHIPNDFVSRLVAASRELAASQAENAKMKLKIRDADIMAAAIDDQIYHRLLGSRTLIADKRLNYGEPFGPEEMSKLLGTAALAQPRQEGVS